MTSHFLLPRRGIGAVAIIVAGLSLSACSSLGGMFGGSKTIDLPDDAGQDPPKVQTRLGSNTSIPVLVNDKPITDYDISQREKLMKLGGAKSTSRKAAMDELIEEQIQLNEAVRMQLKIPEERVAAAYASISGNLKLSPNQMDQALKEQGIQPDTLKRRLRAQITWATLVQRFAREKAQQPSQEDVAAELLGNNAGEEMILREYFLQRIIFVVPKGSSESIYTQRRKEANAFRQRYQGCDAALAQAKELNGVVVQDIGRRTADQLTGSVGEQVQNTKAGQAAPPNRVDEGIELIGVCRIREIQSTAAATASLANKYALDQADDLGKDYMEALRKAAIIEYR